MELRRSVRIRQKEARNEMWSFFVGLVTGFIGFIIWALFGVIGGCGEAVTGEQDPGLYAAMIVGFLLMLGGPLFFWLIYPLWKKARGGKR